MPTDYEQIRLDNIAANQALLASLGLEPPPEVKPPKAEPKPARSKRKASPSSAAARLVALEPSRKSSRLSGQPAPSYTGDGARFFDDEDASVGRRRGRSAAPSSAAGGPSITHLRQLPRAPSPSSVVPDEYDPSYVQPQPTRDPGERGTFRFEPGFEGFTPNVAPWEVLREGSFGGTYWRPFYSTVRREHVTPPIDTFPAEWFDPPIDAETYLTSTTYRPEINKYRVKASQSIEEWEKAGWCRPQDPRGWMECYVQFVLGRRSPDDVRQIQRWAGCAGPRGRFKTSLVKKIAQAGGVDHLHDPEIAPILRQTLLHWAVELTQESFEAYLA